MIPDHIGQVLTEVTEALAAASTRLEWLSRSPYLTAGESFAVGIAQGHIELAMDDCGSIRNRMDERMQDREIRED